MNLSQAKIIAQRVLQGVATPEEKASLRQFIETYPDKGSLNEALFPIQEIHDLEAGVFPEGMEQRILMGILQPGRKEPVPRRPIIRRMIFIGSVAAALLVAIFLLYPRHHALPLYASAQVSTGHLKQIILEDGTHITLNGGSSLRWPKSFSGDRREVYLDGEAYFEVARDSLHPFIIHSPLVSTTVLSTSFSIRSTAGDSSAVVAVASGKVKVQAGGATAYLTPGLQASYQAHDPAGLRQSPVDIAAIGAWKDRWFYFDQTSLRDILASLERSYGLRFKVIDSAVLRCTYSTTFKNISVDTILETLSMMGNVRFDHKNDFIEVRGKPCL